MIASLVQAALIVVLAFIMAASGGLALMAGASVTIDREAASAAGLRQATCWAIGALALLMFVLAACLFAQVVMA